MTQFKWFFDFQLINDDTLGYSYVKQPKNMSFEQPYLKQMYQLMIKNNGITYKNIDKILLKSTNCFSLLFHKNLKQNKIIYQEDYQKFKSIIKNFIIKTCQINYINNYGKCSEKNYSKIKTILYQYGLYQKSGFNEIDIILISYLFSKRQIKQTKQIIKNYNIKNIEEIKKLPMLFLNHNLENLQKEQIYLIIGLILSDFNIKTYKNYKKQFLKFKKLLKTKLISSYYWNNIDKKWHQCYFKNRSFFERCIPYVKK